MPYGVWVAGLTDDPAGQALAVRGTMVLGGLYFAGIFHWVPLALYAADPGPASTALAAASYALIVAGLAGLAGLFGGILHHSVRSGGAPLWLGLPVAWTAFEWTRAHLPDSLALPWLGLGTSLTSVPELVGAAEVVGARGITFWIVAVNGLLATAWIRRSWAPALAALVAAAAIGGWGFWRAGELEPRTVARVAVVQPDVARGTKVGVDTPRPQEIAAALPTVGEASPAGYAVLPASADLVVLPELFIRANPLSPSATGIVAAVREFSGAVGAPVLFGALGSMSYNSAFLLRPDGLTPFRYDKRHLVPLVERVPFQRRESGYEVGEGWPLAEVSGVRYGVFICYESSYPGVARALRLQGADVLVNITNDAWLEGMDPFRRTVALWQHPAHLVMRAVEGRVGVVRSAATGLSLFVDPVGRIYGATELGSPSVSLEGVQTVAGLTIYHRLGDVIGVACTLFALFVLARLLLRGRLGSDRRRCPSLDPHGSRV
ncbi:MAG: apolipoprotein N-acyltransferase [Gemmatimonadetes bacterium]|nr:apolipoprotein N-acyltransferase [Gemmatimonadota bacterium]